MTLRKLIHSVLFILPFALLLADTAKAQNKGLLLQRLEHSFGDGTQPITSVGGSLVAQPFTSTSVTPGDFALSFWVRRDLARDRLTTDPTRLANNANLLSINSLGGFTHIPISNLGNNDRWHFVHVILEDNGGRAGLLILRNMRVYVDGNLVTTLANATGGPTINAASLANLIIDDFDYFDEVAPALESMLSSTGIYGPTRFDRTVANAPVSVDFENLANLQGLINGGSASGFGGFYAEAYAVRRIPPSSDISVNNYHFRFPATSAYPLVNVSTDRRSKIEVVVESEYGTQIVMPNAGTYTESYDSSGRTNIAFSSPEFIYLDRFGNELGSSESTNQASFLDRAVIRAKNIGYIVNGQRTDTGGNAARNFTQAKTDDLRIEWLWELEYAVSLDANDPNLTAATANLNFTGDGSQQSAGFGKFWVKAGTQVSATLDGIINAGTTGDTRYRLNRVSVENNSTSATPDRYMVFDGVDDYLNLAGNAPFPDFTDFTVEFWMRWDGQERNGNERVMSLHTEVGGGNAVNVYSFGITGVDQATPNALFFSAQTGGTVTLDPSFLDTEWHHWAFSYDKTAQEMKIYRDLKLINTRSSFDLNFDVNNAGNGGSLLIGRHSVANDPFGGALNNLRLWTAPLDLATIINASTTQDFPNSTSNLEFEFTFDNDTATQSTGEGRTTYTPFLANYTNPYLTSIP